MAQMLVGALKNTAFSTVITDTFASDMYFADLTSLVSDCIAEPKFKMVISDCPADNPAYTGALSLIRDTLEREQNQLGVAQTKESGLFTGFLGKLGQLFEH